MANRPYLLICLPRVTQVEFHPPPKAMLELRQQRRSPTGAEFNIAIAEGGGAAGKLPDGYSTLKNGRPKIGKGVF